MGTPQIEDSITRDVVIDAPLAVVWELVSQPGWWINDGTITDNTREEKDGAVHVTNATHGTFPITVEQSTEPTHIAYRWAPWGERSLEEATLVEFFLSGEADGPVTVRVVESGFSALGMGEEKVEENYRENSSGWTDELRALRAHLEGR